MSNLRSVFCAFVAFALTGMASIALADQQSLPNIVLIFADDLGWKDVGYNGTDFYQTPNIDALAKSGMVFPGAYAAAGNCAPSRACLLSGTYTPRHHVYAVGSTDRGPKKSQRLIPIPNRSGLAKDNVTIAERKKSSLRSGSGISMTALPQLRGFLSMTQQLVF